MTSQQKAWLKLPDVPYLYDDLLDRQPKPKQTFTLTDKFGLGIIAVAVLFLIWL